MRAGPAFLSALLLAAVPLCAQDPTPGLSHELAIHRAATLSDITYDVSFRIPAELGNDVTGEEGPLRTRINGAEPRNQPL